VRGRGGSIRAVSTGAVELSITADLNGGAETALHKSLRFNSKRGQCLPVLNAENFQVVAAAQLKSLPAHTTVEEVNVHLCGSAELNCLVYFVVCGIAALDLHPAV
jgi:hypothetical protein